MTTKMFCDGCDREIADRRVTTVSLSYAVPPGARQPTAPIPFDLCEGCFNSFRFNHLPKSWARVEPEVPRVAGKDAA